jgi:geranylgeranyl pyrophosphate synthase
VSGGADTAGRSEAGTPPALEPILAAAGPELQRSLDMVERRLAEVAAGHGEGLGRYASATLVAGGKRMRPLLVFLCGGTEPPERLVPGAVAVELLHMATLVHDDVLDRAELRRGRPTVFVSGGRTAATATGDLLFSRSFFELVATGSRQAVATLSAASSALARGELMQRADAWSDSVTVERYLERCTLKTGRLFEAACRLGAILGEEGPAGATTLGRYGACVGLAFQILDDVLDVAGPAERTGKRRGADLLDGTVTLPLIMARRRDAQLGALDLRGVQSPADAEAVCDRIEATGALEDARALALERVTEAKALLAVDGSAAPGRRALELVAEGVVERSA